MKQLNLRNLFIIAAVLVVSYLFVSYFDVLTGWLGLLFSAAMPLIAGAGMAFILNILLRKIEVLYFPNSTKKIVQKTRRPVSMLLSILAILAILALIFNMVLPGLWDALQIIGVEIPPLFDRTIAWLTQQFTDVPELQQALADLQIDWPSLLGNAWDLLMSGATGVLTSVAGIVSALFGGIVDFVVASIFAVYLLFNKEMLLRHLKKLLRAFLPRRFRTKLLYALQTANQTFADFITGQCLEALILGLLCTGGMMIFRFPDPVMIGAVVGVTALVPLVGGYVGAGIGAFIIFTVNPMQALFFLIFIVILQQLEGNIIYPRVMGSSIGLPSMWVLAAIVIGGGLMGVLGMLLGVPLAATLYKLLGRTVNKRLIAVPAVPSQPLPPEDAPPPAQ